MIRMVVLIALVGGGIYYSGAFERFGDERLARDMRRDVSRNARADRECLPTDGRFYEFRILREPPWCDLYRKRMRELTEGG